VSFGADLFETWLSPVSNAYGFAEARHVVDGMPWRLIQFESHLSLTGANADERYCCPPGAETLIVLAIAHEMLKNSAMPPEQAEKWRRALQSFSMERAARASGVSVDTLMGVANRLRNQTPSLAVAGGPTCRSKYGTVIQIGVNLINIAAGNYGKTLSFERFEHAPVGTHRQLTDLVEEMEAGRVEALIVHDTNPEFAFPEPERWRAAVKRVPLTVQLAPVRDSASESYDIILPIHHWLERWDLVEPRSGLHCVQQPTIAPWCDSVHPGEAFLQIMNALMEKRPEPNGHYEEFLRGQWNKIRGGESANVEFDDFWQEVLASGGYWERPTARNVQLDARAADAIPSVELAFPEPGTITALPITTIRYGDGRQTGRPWLHEMPDPITTLVWDTPLLISPETAKKWKCRSGDMVRIECGGDTITVPAYVQPGTSDAVAAMPLGVPSNAYAQYHYAADSHLLHRLAGHIDTSSGSISWVGAPVEFKGVVGRVRLARLQGHNSQKGRGIAQTTAISETGQSEQHPAEEAIVEADLYPKHEHPVHDWGMVIDLSRCIGCGACAVACQAENNIYVVGRKQCLNGRELSWLRIERFIDRGRIVFLPMLCQHCEHAPCETVCPVYAALHSSEGLNQQIYNRCVGTRYCANNCPYKVRRFNWFTYKVDPPLERQFNPDVSIRTRGIMEKCTFCVQRIREHKEIAKVEGRALRDGEVVPACAQSCPTHAITFGDLNDGTSEVATRFSDPRGYTIFSELNTQPSIVYLRRECLADGTGTESV
jgi:molybdopterin-containing oxidoreductase family iron-sulfur binding subunit